MKNISPNLFNLSLLPNAVDAV